MQTMGQVQSPAKDIYDELTVNELRLQNQGGSCMAQTFIKNLKTITDPNKRPKMSTTQVEMNYVPYGSDIVNDVHWGCAWRSIQMVLSSNFGGEIPDFYWLYNYFGQRQILENIYLTKKGLNQLPVFLKNSEFAPHELGNGWAEPFIGNLIFYYLGIETGLKTINDYPKKSNAPSEVFEENLDFQQLCGFLVEHFQNYRSPIMIDDGQFAMVIYGIIQENDQVIMSIGDPHIWSNKLLDGVGCYDVTLDIQGKQLYHNITPETINQYIYPQSYLGVKFDGKPWMMTYTTKKFNEWNNWQEGGMVIDD